MGDFDVVDVFTKADAFINRPAVSGVYQRREARSYSTAFGWDVVETVRLDVDGWYPQNMASGSFVGGLLSAGYVEWAGHLRSVGPGAWEGTIDGRWGDVNLLPHSGFKIEVAPLAGYFVRPEMTITFTGNAPDVTRKLTFETSWFRAVDIEWDTVEGAARVTSFDTGTHANRPAVLPREVLTIQKVYDRAGVDLRRGPQPPESVIVPFGLSGEDAKWADSELNDVMRQYWTKYQARAQWAVWLLFAGLHEDPTARGVMFDHAGTYKRQGAAVFNDWWLDDPETIAFDNPDVHTRRRRFYTACHELGHCFNFIHSFEPLAPLWWPLGGEPNALSFMNYVEVAPNTHDFFSRFEYRFSNQELRFLRHAPERQVKMGGPAYGDDVRDALRTQASDLTVQAMVRRRDRVFDFLEPVILDLAVTNRSRDLQLVDASMLADGHTVSVSIVGPDGRSVLLRPHVVRCLAPRRQVLRPGESLRHTAFVSAGAAGWVIAEPGPYRITAALQTPHGLVEAEPLHVRVAHPAGRDEEVIAQDYFSDEVGRVLALGGTALVDHVHELLRELVDRYAERPVARHAALALGLPLMKRSKLLQMRDGQAGGRSVAEDGASVVARSDDPEQAKRLLEVALLGGTGSDTFPTVLFEGALDRVATWLERQGDPKAAQRFRAPSTSGAAAEQDAAKRNARPPRRPRS